MKNYIKRLNAHKNTHKLALLQLELIRDLIAYDETRKAELPAAEKAIKERKAYLASLQVQIDKVKL